MTLGRSTTARQSVPVLPIPAHTRLTGPYLAKYVVASLSAVPDTFLRDTRPRDISRLAELFAPHPFVHAPALAPPVLTKSECQARKWILIFLE
jgi:hypothetical protein